MLRRSQVREVPATGCAAWLGLDPRRRTQSPPRGPSRALRYEAFPWLSRECCRGTSASGQNVGGPGTAHRESVLIPHGDGPVALGEQPTPVRLCGVTVPSPKHGPLAFGSVRLNCGTGHRASQRVLLCLPPSTLPHPLAGRQGRGVHHHGPLAPLSDGDRRCRSSTMFDWQSEPSPRTVNPSPRYFSRTIPDRLAAQRNYFAQMG